MIRESSSWACKNPAKHGVIDFWSVSVDRLQRESALLAPSTREGSQKAPIYSEEEIESLEERLKGLGCL